MKITKIQTALEKEFIKGYRNFINSPTGEDYIIDLFNKMRSDHSDVTDNPFPKKYLLKRIDTLRYLRNQINNSAIAMNNIVNEIECCIQNYEEGDKNAS